LISFDNLFTSRSSSVTCYCRFSNAHGLVSRSSPPIHFAFADLTFASA
jgi:hypothetical protein